MSSYSSRKKNPLRHDFTDKEIERFRQLVTHKGLYKLKPHENNQAFMARMERWYKEEQIKRGVMPSEPGSAEVGGG